MQFQPVSSLNDDIGWLRQSRDVCIYCEHERFGLLFVVYSADDKAGLFITLISDCGGRTDRCRCY